MQVNKTLILTGWSKPEYLAAAAAALTALDGGADVAGVSMEALAATLAERGSNYETVYVLGVGLSRNVGPIVEALGRLKAKGVKTVWVSCLNAPPAFISEVSLGGAGASSRGFDEMVESPDSTLLDATADCLHLGADQLKRFRAYAEAAADSGPTVAAYRHLAEAAGYAHRMFHDDAVYAEAILALSRRLQPKDWPSRLREVDQLFDQVGKYELVGRSAKMDKVRSDILLAARHPRARVLVLGESGTGKELVARQIHANSERKDAPFVPFNCAAVTPTLLEDRFFGHEKGGFTHATAQVPGLFERANHGMLFLDEIGELSMAAQAMLLRVLTDGKIVRVGGTREIDVDVRLVMATNCNLPRMVREGSFRADLYQRISMMVIRLPSLAERKQDIGTIARNWWYHMVGENLPESHFAALLDYDYPGNVRELINLLERADALGERDFAKVLSEHKELNKDLYAPIEEASGLPDNLDEAVGRHVKDVLAKYGGNKTAAAKALGISLNTLKKHLQSTVG